MNNVTCNSHKSTVLYKCLLYDLLCQSSIANYSLLYLTVIKMSSKRQSLMHASRIILIWSPQRRLSCRLEPSPHEFGLAVKLGVVSVYVFDSKHFTHDICILTMRCCSCCYFSWTWFYLCSHCMIGWLQLFVCEVFFLYLFVIVSTARSSSFFKESTESRFVFLLLIAVPNNRDKAKWWQNVALCHVCLYLTCLWDSLREGLCRSSIVRPSESSDKRIWNSTMSHQTSHGITIYVVVGCFKVRGINVYWRVLFYRNPLWIDKIHSD